jgi:diacylglycerol kinase family enzyme
MNPMERDAPPAPLPARRIALLVNPAAGRHDPWTLARLAGFLARDGATVETLTSTGPGDLAARVADLEVDLVAVAGGDGTVNEVVGALVRRPEPRPRLVVVPQGTANVLAHEHRLPHAARAIAAAVRAGRTRPIHLGTAIDADGGERPFFLMASAGIDAEVVAAVENRRFRPLKKLAFLLSALRLGGRRRTRMAVEVSVPGEAAPRCFDCGLAIVAKAAHYGGPFVLTRATASDRPGLRFVGLIDDRPAALLAAVLAIARGRLEISENVVSLPAERVRLAPDPAAGRRAVQIDGEPAGATPLDVRPAGISLDLVVADEG